MHFFHISFIQRNHFNRKSINYYISDIINFLFIKKKIKVKKQYLLLCAIVLIHFTWNFYRKLHEKFVLVTQNLYGVLTNYYGARGTKIKVIFQIAFIAAAWFVFSGNIHFRGRMRFAETRELPVKYHEYQLTSTLVGSGAEITFVFSRGSVISISLA